MNEKRFNCVLANDYHIINDNVDNMTYFLQEGNDVEKLVGVLNEQQDTIQRMKYSLNTIYRAFENHYGYDMRNAVWLIDELSYDEIVDELYIAETDSKNRKEASMYWKKKCDEQQATIRKLQDLCGESDGENAKLRIENKRLQKELNNCEKFRYTVFKRMNDEYIKERSIK